MEIICGPFECILNALYWFSPVFYPFLWLNCFTLFDQWLTLWKTEWWYNFDLNKNKKFLWNGHYQMCSIKEILYLHKYSMASLPSPSFIKRQIYIRRQIKCCIVACILYILHAFMHLSQWVSGENLDLNLI